MIVQNFGQLFYWYDLLVSYNKKCTQILGFLQYQLAVLIVVNFTMLPTMRTPVMPTHTSNYTKHHISNGFVGFLVSYNFLLFFYKINNIFVCKFSIYCISILWSHLVHPNHAALEKLNAQTFLSVAGTKLLLASVSGPLAPVRPTNVSSAHSKKKKNKKLSCATVKLMALRRARRYTCFAASSSAYFSK